MSDYPCATQSYKSENKKAKVSRTAVCPVHEKRTSDFQFPVSMNNKVYWQFKCGYSGHEFLAIPDPSAPSTQEDVAGWIAKQEAKKLKMFQ